MQLHNTINVLSIFIDVQDDILLLDIFYGFLMFIF